MKIETFVKGSIVISIIFILGLVVVGSGILQQEYGVSNGPNFNNITQYQKESYTLQSGLENESMKQVADPGQADEDNTNDIVWWTYTKKSLKAVDQSIRSADSSKGAINEILTYLQVNPMIIGGIITFIVLSFVFALITWWKGKRP